MCEGFCKLHDWFPPHSIPEIEAFIEPTLPTFASAPPTFATPVAVSPFLIRGKDGSESESAVEEMDKSGVFSAADDPAVEPSGAGTIRRIRLENFMCHSNLQIELGRWVNFITGQNGSGKSAVLTALCVSFGCRAKGTQRAARLKDFIKTGCSHAIVEVEIRNEGADAYKYEIYGNTIIIERRISESSSSIVLKDHQGKKVSGRRDELNELVGHFNIDVDNPCVIMSQDRSREFLHSGNDKDKFKFFYRASLLQQVDELLQNIGQQVEAACSLVEELERSIKPIERELDELKIKIKNMEHLEKISQEAKQLKKKLAWSWVFNYDKQMEEQRVKLETLEARRPRCQARIDTILKEVESLRDHLSKKKAQVARLKHDIDEANRRQDEKQQELTLAMRRKLERELEHGREEKNLQKMATDVKKLEQQVKDIEEQYLRHTQAENSEIEERIKALEEDLRISKSTFSRLRAEERALLEYVSKGKDEISMISEEIDRLNKEHHSIQSQIKEFQLHQTNKVTAFGGGRVLNLLQAIERHHLKFSSPPIGPIGAHLTLVDKKWACAVENALGRLLNAFIVTNHKDLQTLKACAREAHYNFVPIFMYDFARQRLTMPNHMLPQTNNPTTLSVLQSDNHTILNVLVDMGSAERQVLVDDYDAGKALAFDQRIPNLKEVYTAEGRRMFSRNSVQTVLPPNRKARDARLQGSFDDQINNLMNEKSNVEKEINDHRKRKREAEEKLSGLQNNLQSVKRRCLQAERESCTKEMALKDAYESRASEASLPPTSTTDELSLDISRIRERIKEKEALLEKLRYTTSEAEKEAENLKLSFENICDSTNEEINACQKAEEDERKFELQIKDLEKALKHYENIMKDKVLSEIKVAEQEFQELEALRKESSEKASIICPESEIEALGGWDGAMPEQLSAKLDRLNQRLQHENQQCSESIDDLRMIYEKKELKIVKKRQQYRALHEKLDVYKMEVETANTLKQACKHALELRWNKFRRNAKSLRLGLTLNFNCNLGRKGISGHINVDYEKKTLLVEVTMPQDASGNAVHDTRGLSGGERSFSTLCFALALHQMTESPFRAMDEFDVFMDAVSRKISLETLMEFALEQKSQWIFITPHDISMVKSHERVMKQQMAAPRP